MNYYYCTCRPEWFKPLEFFNYQQPQPRRFTKSVEASRVSSRNSKQGPLPAFKVLFTCWRWWKQLLPFNPSQRRKEDTSLYPTDKLPVRIMFHLFSFCRIFPPGSTLTWRIWKTTSGLLPCHPDVGHNIIIIWVLITGNPIRHILSSK